MRALTARSFAKRRKGRTRRSTAASPPCPALADRGRRRHPGISYRRGERRASGYGGFGRWLVMARAPFASSPWPGGLIRPRRRRAPCRARRAGWRRGRPFTNVQIGCERQLGFLGVEQRRRNRKIGERHTRPGEIGVFREVSFEHARVAVESSMALATTAASQGPKLKKALTTRSKKQRLAPFLAPMRELPALPPRDIRARPRIVRP